MHHNEDSVVVDSAALRLAKECMPRLVYNMSVLERNPLTYIEVQSLLNGITVEGRRLVDEHQVVHIGAAWRFLIQAIEHGVQIRSRKFTMELHKILGKAESLTIGQFRHDRVKIRGTSYRPPRQIELPVLFDRMLSHASEESEIEEIAVDIFLDFTRNQYFFDCNKRMGQLLMNGLLLSNDRNPISIREQEKETFFKALIEFYESGNDRSLKRLLLRSQLNEDAATDSDPSDNMRERNISLFW